MTPLINRLKSPVFVIEFFPATVSSLLKIIRKGDDYCGFIITIISFILAATMPFLWREGADFWLRLTSGLVISVVIFGTIFTLAHRLVSFDAYTSKLSRLIYLYLELILVFASAYLWIYLLGGDTMFDSFHTEARKLSNQKDFVSHEYLYNLGILIIDTLYFSTVNATSVGFGDIVPSAVIPKILVPIHKLFQMSVITIGFYKLSNHQGMRANNITPPALDKIIL